MPIITKQKIRGSDATIFSSIISTCSITTDENGGQFTQGEWSSSVGDGFSVQHEYIYTPYDGIETMTDLTIHKSAINYLNGQIISVKLCLENESANMYGMVMCYERLNNEVVGETLTYTAENNSSLFEMDIKDKFLSYGLEQDFTLRFEKASIPLCIQSDFANMYIEIEYVNDSSARHPRKTFSLANSASVELNLATGNTSTAICDVSPANSIMGVGICHVNNQLIKEDSLGGNLRLNLNEKLVKETDNSYLYTDEKGDYHRFLECCYYTSKAGEKTYISDTSKIEVDADGELTYSIDGSIYKVVREYKSNTNLKVITELEGFKNVDYVEQRIDDVKQLEDKIKAYEQTFNDYVICNRTSRDKTYLSSNYATIQAFDEFMSKVSYYNLLLAKSDVPQLENLLNTKNYYNETSSNDVIPTEPDTDAKKVYASIKSAIYELNLKIMRYDVIATEPSVEHAFVSNPTADFTQISISQIDEIVDGEKKTNFSNEDDYIYGYTLKELLRQRNLYIEQYERQLVEFDQQVGYINDQLTLFTQRSYSLKDTLTGYYKEYLALIDDREEMKRSVPVNFLSNGDVVKGFNEFGDLCIIYDRHDNYGAIEFEKYVVSGKENHRIKNFFDNNERKVSFIYDNENMLSYITDIYGNKTTFKYDENLVLSKILFEDEEELDLSFSNGIINSVSSKKNALVSYVTHKNSRPLSIYTRKIVAGTPLNTDLEMIEFIFNPTGCLPMFGTTIKTSNQEEKFLFYYGDALQEYVLIKDGLVVDAERYEYVPYWNGTTAQSNPHNSVIKTTKSSLFVPYENFTFVDGDSETTTFNQFEKPSQTVSTSGTGTSRIVTNTTQYIYDNNQTLVEEIVTETFSNSATEIVRHKKYTYNAYGEIVRTESYVDGEIHTNGKTIEETVYDDKGNVIRSFTYNSLDPSSKFYTEYVVDDKGKTLAELDGTGENKTEYIYDDKNKVIGEKFPNGSTLSYGRDESGEVVAITQSAEEGVENSTQKHYACGELTRVESGNNTIDYTYDAKRRINSIKLNGQNYLSCSTSDFVDENGIKVQETYAYSQIENELSFTRKYMSDGKPIFSGYCDALMDTYKLQYEYDERKNLTKIIDTHNNETTRTLTYTYNDQDQVTSYVEKEGDTVKVNETVTYNGNGQVASKSIYTKDAVITQGVSYAYNDDSTKMLSSVSSSGLTIYPKYDKLKRSKGKKVTCYDTTLYDENIVYKKVGDHATVLPSVLCRTRYAQYDNTLSSYSATKYEYDNMGNIVKIIVDDMIVCRYEYDALNRLIREDNKDVGKTYLFYYDNNGNITNKKEYAFTLKNRSDLDELTCTTVAYKYDGDKLVNYNGQAITYDLMGCPTTYKGKNLTWSNGRLTSYDGNTFTYDTLGRRLKKNNYECFYDSEGKLVRYRDMQFIYDETGVIGYHELGATFAFVKDAQGNIIELLAPNGYIIARYVYDAWGNCKVIDTNGNEITSDNNEGFRNPFRYRGYFYDVETGLYFLKSRYYDPETGRFISPDGIEYADPETINGLNLYAYCGNNPVMNIDPDGHSLIVFLGSLLLSFIASSLFGSQIVGGVSSTINGGVAVKTGISLLAFGPIGWILGGILILVGAATMLMGMSEVASGLTGEINPVRSLLGNDLFNGLYLGLNTASSIGSLLGNVYVKYANVKSFGTSISATKGADPYQRYGLYDNKGLKQYRFFDRRGNAWYDKDFRHDGNLKFPHYHIWINGQRQPDHLSFIQLIIQLLRRR